MNILETLLERMPQIVVQVLSFFQKRLDLKMFRKDLNIIEKCHLAPSSSIALSERDRLCVVYFRQRLECASVFATKKLKKGRNLQQIFAKNTFFLSLHQNAGQVLKLP